MGKKERKNKYNIKQLIIVCLLFFNLIFLVSIFGRYVVKSVNNFYARSKEFYFYSDKLDVDNPAYQIENWSGVDDYSIIINMNSYANNLLSTSYDIDYEISYFASDNIICNLSKESGIIYGDRKTDFFTLTNTPNTTLKTGDNVFVEITAKATTPYEKTIKGRFTLIVGQEQLTYEIQDVANRPYLEVNITNTLSYYIVQEAFDTYAVGDKITRDTYLELLQTNKEKCYSAIITINFDTDYLLMDMTNEAFASSISTTNINKNGYTYINSITFKIDALSSKKVRFYKVDETQDYTNNNSEIITITNS